jgi:hypothetical protein
VITAEDINQAHEAAQAEGKRLGQQASMREVHYALCTYAGIDPDPLGNYINQLTLRLGEWSVLSHDQMDMISTIMRHVFVVGVGAKKTEVDRVG